MVLYSYFTFSFYYHVVYFSVVSHSVLLCFCLLCPVLCCAVLCCAVLCCAVLCCAVLCCGVVWCGVVWCGVVWCPPPLIAFLSTLSISFPMTFHKRRSLFSVADADAKSSPDLCAFTRIQILINHFHMRFTEIFIFLSVYFSFQSILPSFSTSPSLTDLFPHFLDI